MTVTHKKSLTIYLAALCVEFTLLVLVAWHAGWSLSPYMTGLDTFDYSTIARNLVDHQSFSKSLTIPFIPNFFRLPGYPFWLAFVYFVFKSFTPAVFLGMTIFALSAPLVYLITREVFSEKLAFWAGIIFALEPRMAFSAPFLLSEQIFIPLFLLAVFFAVKFINYPEQKRFILLSAALFGLLALFKAVVLYLWPVFIILFYLQLEKNHQSLTSTIKLIASSTLILIVVMAPWFIRNKIVLNTWQLSSTGGLVIYWGHLEILERYLGTPSDLAYQKLIDKANRLAGADWGTVEAAKILTHEAFTEIKSHPKEYFRAYISNLPLFFITDGYKGILSYISNINQNYVNFSDLLFRLKFGEFISGIKNLSLFGLVLPVAGRGVWLILTIFSFFGVFLSIKSMSEKRLPIIMLAMLILYFAVLTGPIGFDPRYRMPVNGFLFVFALVSVFYILKIDFKAKEL